MEDKIIYLEEKLYELSVIVSDIAEANVRKHTVTDDFLGKVNESLKEFNLEIQKIKSFNKLTDERLKIIESKLDF